MADPFRMVILIVLIAGAVKVANMYFRDRRENRAVPEIDESVTRQIHELEERVRVLETIVTDKRHDLRREIDSL
ncbi:MAG: hypothetical protein EX258_10170 [Sphingomonadaceae bacterium]|nr:MAG: hypothetical protein EX258_10170 [Sphingomonadaceae bacterium]